MTLTGNWSYPTAIRFGSGRIAEIGEACIAAGITKPLLVTDRGLKSMEITTRTLDLVEAAGLGRAIFAEVDPNPNDTNVEEGLKIYREGGYDGVIAFGGGSRISATGGPAQTPPAFTRSLRFPQRRAPVPRSDGPL